MSRQEGLLHRAGAVKSSGLARICRIKELAEGRRRLRRELEPQGWHEPKRCRHFDPLGA